ARIDAGGALRVGPESAGADPGPACYGTGTRPTVTDANLVLGRLVETEFLGGAMRLDTARAPRGPAPPPPRPRPPGGAPPASGAGRGRVFRAVPGAGIGGGPGGAGRPRPAAWVPGGGGRGRGGGRGDRGHGTPASGESGGAGTRSARLRAGGVRRSRWSARGG